MKNYITNNVKCQYIVENNILHDYTKSGKEIDWRGKKAMSMEIAEIISSYDENKSLQIASCGSYLDFVMSPDTNKLKLHNANFCRQRMCPLCTWRRTIKLGIQMDKLYKYIMQSNDYDNVFVTLTIKNASADDLNETLNKMERAAQLLLKIRKIKKILRGYTRTLEITYNARQNTFHCHYHFIWTVEKSYFSFDENYISTSELSEIWRNCMGIDYLPVVFMQKIKPSENQTITDAVCETAKYPLKATDILHIRNKEKRISVTHTLDDALRGRRLINFGGIVKNVRKMLNQSDVENDSDLIHIDNDNITAPELLQHYIYTWRNGMYISLNMDMIHNNDI